MQSAGSFQKFIVPFSQKLLAIDVASLPTNNYSSRYLQHLLQEHLYYLHIYASVLHLLQAHSKKPASQIALADFGSGNGLLGLFAKFAGFKQVWLCDMDAAFVNSSRLLATKLELNMDGFVTGSIAELESAVSGHTLDAVIGTDVIEHIYSVPHFLQTMAHINPEMVTVFTTASNPHNYLKCRQLIKLQLQDELQGSNPEDFDLAGPTATPAFLQMRKEIIADKFPAMEPTVLQQLAASTRGMRASDILTAAEDFVRTGVMPSLTDKWPNTCHPLTGTFTERILSIKDYGNMFAATGFQLKVYNGFYNVQAGGLKKNVNSFRNLFVKLTGKYAAPFISLVGYKSA
ncbi:MAG: class I SAM-dependent methyltransferase [Chitinophagaceae bacterium]|nr:MAG: class I SAM-dependent methyltransferase [Chitinophagaceae bacterium]